VTNWRRTGAKVGVNKGVRGRRCTDAAWRGPGITCYLGSACAAARAPTRNPADMIEIFKAAIQRGASDIHIKTGDFIRARITGDLVPLTQQRLSRSRSRRSVPS
jgi:hypothetical protein